MAARDGTSQNARQTGGVLLRLKPVRGQLEAMMLLYFTLMTGRDVF